MNNNLIVMKNRTRWRHIQEWQFSLFLLLELSPLLVFEFDFDFLSLLCNTNTLQNILMMLSTNVEQDKMTCCVQEWQLWWDWVGRRGTFVVVFLKPFLVFNCSCWFCFPYQYCHKMAMAVKLSIKEAFICCPVFMEHGGTVLKGLSYFSPDFCLQSWENGD